MPARLIWPLIAAAAVVAMAVGTFKPFYLQALTPRRESMRAVLSSVSFRKVPGFEAFLTEARSRTKRGDSIALLVPMREWDGYSYAYYRASYVLAGREVLPLLDPQNRVHAENLAAADYLLMWRTQARVPDFEVAWTSADGALLRKRK